MKLAAIMGLLLLTSCSQKTPEELGPDDDYVLIEFASKLEEDYHRIHNIPYDASSERQIEPGAEAPAESTTHEPMDPHHP